MKRNLLFFLLSFLCLEHTCTQDLDAYIISPAGTVSFNHDGGNYKTENPPWVLPMGSWQTYFFIDGVGGAAGSAPWDMIHYNSIHVEQGPTTVSLPDGCTPENLYPWRRNYYAVTTAQILQHPTMGSVALGFLHGENRSMVGTTQEAVDCDGYGLGYPAYGAFVCGSWLPHTAATNWAQGYYNDLGPIVWPASGYFLANGQKSSLGCSEPASIQTDDGYLYVFYKDMSHYVVPAYDRHYPGFPNYIIYHHPQDPDWGFEEGRMGGIRVARVPVADALNPQAYRTYYEDPYGNVSWNPSLPPGFTKENITAFFRTQGPMSTDIMRQTGWDCGKFSVAKAAGTNYYFGVAAYQDYNDLWVDGNGSHPKMKLSLRYSYDLLHWYGNRVFEVSNDWTGSHFNYPIFLNSQGNSNTIIDPNNFYVLGTPSDMGSLVYRMNFSIPQPPPIDYPPPACVDDPQNGIFCPQSRNGQVMNGLAATLDLSPAKAPAVYPNPGAGVYNLSYTLKDHAITQLCVLDVTGRRLQAGPTTMRGPGLVTESVDITSRARGVYMLELTVNGGKKIFKIVYQ